MTLRPCFDALTDNERPFEAHPRLGAFTTCSILNIYSTALKLRLAALRVNSVRGQVMYAIVETGGKQFRVASGDTVRVPTISGEIGSEVSLGRVLAVFPGGTSGTEVLTGERTASAQVKATIAGNDRGKKILVFKFKRKKQYKRTQGHRQDYTEVKIGDIVV